MSSIFSWLDIPLLLATQEHLVTASGLHAEYTDPTGECIAAVNLRALSEAFRQWRGSPEGDLSWHTAIRKAIQGCTGAGQAVLVDTGSFSGAVTTVTVRGQIALGCVCGTLCRNQPESRYVAGAQLLAQVAQASASYRSGLMRAESNSHRSQAYLASEIHTLRAQADPHFLFNMLNTIQAHAALENAVSTSSAITELARFLRHTLRRRSPITSLRDEFSHIESYLTLERRRFGNRLRWHIELPPEIAAVKIPCLLVQPLVQNAVRHGVEPKTAGGTILVEARAENSQTLCIEVADDGAGSDTSLIAALQDRPGSAGVDVQWGLSLVREKLTSFYGNAARMTIDSRPDWGFWAQIVLPIHLPFEVLIDEHSRDTPDVMGV